MNARTPREESDDQPPRLRAVVGRGRAIHIAVASVVLNLLGLALPLALLQVYDRIIPNSSHGTLLLLVALVIGALLLEGALRLARAEIIGWTGIQFEHAAGRQAFARALATPTEDLEKIGAGELLERLSGLPAFREFFGENWTLVVCDLPFVAVFLGAIWYLAGTLVLAPLTVLGLFVAVAAWELKGARGAVEAFHQLRDRRQNFTMEVIHGVHAVKAMAMEQQMVQRYARLQESVTAAAHRMMGGTAMAMNVSALFAQLTTLSVVVFGAVMVVDNALTVGGLAACTMLAGRALQPVQRAAGLWTRFHTVVHLRERFDSIFALPRERSGTHRPESVEGRLELHGVSFAFGAAEPLFHELDLRVEPGERVCIVGDNASGKSTLLRLMLGVLRPTAGEVLLDGRPLRDLDRDTLLAGGLAYVPQTSHLVQGTILDNLTLFRPHLRRQALKAAQELGLDEVIAALPHGYSTMVGKGSGDSLPRGVVQRIAVARAVATAPRVLLFDEANAAMDGSGDETLRRFLERWDRDHTLVMVSLRPSLQRLADRVLALQDGRLVPRQIAPAAAMPPAAQMEGR
ncbi:MAG: ABC transporter transmembrane domain-containing protein [Pseudomonadota bacterium]